MLELKKITKDYPAGNNTVSALKGIDLKFRKSEFVSILGPSGCEKTTMLNIIGGLDKYTSGDLVINGKSTKDFNDRDWDSYRNHSVGFVFQSYNLIPHQSVLQNVELALSLSGVSKSERKARAKKALEDVGLGNQLNKRPGEMSGGQMQRVAIARALVNNPDIILADEPTGALDSETSLQVMDILKEVSKDRLVIMVTHNPELAEKYSTRIVRMLDGVIKDDSAPLNDEEIEKERAFDLEKANAKRGKKEKLPSMSFATSFALSLKNLFTKKGRTALTSFAGSIGIIGIALIISVSQGTTAYIDAVQEDTLASYPLTIESTHVDLSTIMQTFMESASSENPHQNNAVYQKPVVYDIVNALNTIEAKENDLQSFKSYIESEKNSEDEESTLNSALSGIQYTYNIDMPVYTKNIDGEIIISDTTELMRELIMKNMGADSSMLESASSSNPMMSMMNTSSAASGIWQEMLSGDNGDPISPLLKKQYDVVYGSWPNAYNEVVVVLDKNNELNDMTLYALGLISEAEMDKIADAAFNKTSLEVPSQSWSYEDICNMEFRVVLNSQCYTLDEASGLYTDLRSTSAGLKYLYDNGITLKVTGIIKPSENSISNMLFGAVGYTNLLTEHIIEESKKSSSINAQLENSTTDIFTGLRFKDSAQNISNKQKETEFRSHVDSLNDIQKAAMYIEIMSIPSEETVSQALDNILGSLKRADMEDAMIQALVQQTGMNSEEIEGYISAMSDDELFELFETAAEENFRLQYAEQIKTQLAALSTEQTAAALTMAMESYTTEQCALYYDEVIDFSSSTYEANLMMLGYVDLDNPSTINLYAASFADKDLIEEVIADYNEGTDELSKIEYTDYVGLMMSSITTIIDAITYVLISFVAVSLIVSSIMIGVITLISVQERTKEIGILRAIGASKKNVSSMFNAETLIIGFTSGALGVGITYLLCIPINAILNALTGIANLRAYLPIEAAITLVIISMLLTLISGIIPSRSAAKKDPVVALRTE